MIFFAGMETDHPPCSSQVPKLSSIRHILYLFDFRYSCCCAQQNVHGAQIYVHYGKGFHGSELEA